jgi:hypothetical protein
LASLPNRGSIMSVKQALRALSNREMTFEELEAYQRQIDHEENDRGACLLMATNLEIALDTVVFRNMEYEDALTDNSGPLNTFHQKITLGRALRLYGPDTQHNLDYIRAIRNAFAHSHAPISFETKEIKDAVKLLKDVAPLPPLGVAAAPLPPEHPTTRKTFQRVCDVTAHNLLTWIYSESLRDVGYVRQPLP